MELYALVLALAFLSLIGVGVDGLECYSCQNVTYMADCNAVTVCPSGSMCHAEFSTFAGQRRYSLGCKPNAACPSQPTGSPASSHIVGRSLYNDTCSQCCETGMCNRQLCQDADPDCTDTTDCTVIGAFSNLCVDANHIRNVCKKFCGLCSLVDGGWSNWGTWSTCDVTCERGTKTRTRMCNNPKPADGGKTCVGSFHDSSDCKVAIQCPVAGGWSQWSTWGSCSVTCDIGMQRRDRSCNSPYPVFAGDHCYGDSRDDRLCHPGACADGHWSAWSSWGSCTVTCGGGLRNRPRTCDNPGPSLTGKYCQGTPVGSEVCNTKPCEATIAFSARNLNKTTWSAGEKLIYTQTILNVGSGYDSRTGYFTAPVGGTYQFNVHVCSLLNKWFEVEIYAGGHAVGSANHFNNVTSGACSSGIGLAVLTRGAKAWIRCAYDSHVYHSYSYEWNSFSGVLIGP